MKFVEYSIQSFKPQILVLLAKFNISNFEKSDFDPTSSNSNISPLLLLLFFFFMVEIKSERVQKIKSYKLGRVENLKPIFPKQVEEREELVKLINYL